jgi:phosphoribosyl 1,2-cyclic phosphodiesterase
MSVELCILASGSSGNCTVLRCPAGVMLIDAGIGPRTVARRLDGTGVRADEVRAICLTHLDHDHFSRRWIRTIIDRGITLHCHHDVSRRLREQLGTHLFAEDAAAMDLLRRRLVCFDGCEFQPLPGLRLTPLHLPHDRCGSHGFVIEGFGTRIGYATDLGTVSQELLERFADLDLLAMESNYDPQMQLASRRPVFLKQRIMNGHGHLSNQQAFEAVQAILNRAERRRRPLPAHIVLLHRSRECNCPERMRELFGRDHRIASRLILAHQHERTEWLRARRRAPLTGEQLLLEWA